MERWTNTVQVLVVQMKTGARKVLQFLSILDYFYFTYFNRNKDLQQQTAKHSAYMFYILNAK